MAAVDDIVRAWVIEGRNPAYHAEQKRRLRREWPMLADAIEHLVAERLANSTPAAPAPTSFRPAPPR